ncbi:MAG TPA: hypothetical protein VF556_09385 [Pyrinomonadaceae bacterium]|jgi:hypothetical protein
MSLLEQQNFLAKIYTDEQFRRAFLSEPEKTGKENSLNENEIAEIFAVLPEEIGFFAESLFRKRLREVEKLLPLTREITGADFTPLFREFARIYNPQTVKKHLEDAIAFCDFLRENNLVTETSKNVAKYEQTKLNFYGYEKRFAHCFLSGDVREIFHRNEKNSKAILKKKMKLAIWLRSGNTVRHFFI